MSVPRPPASCTRLAASFGAIVLGASLSSPAQTAPPTPAYTLHAYANLVQIPVLVLAPDRSRQREPVAPDRFSVSIDRGPWFRATHVRQEGDDPITLSLLIDVNSNIAELLPVMTPMLDALAANLRSDDRISIFVLDCSLVESANQIPPDRERIELDADAALGTEPDRRAKRTHCAKRVPLVAALTAMTRLMSNLPGRRVILAVTSGDSGTSGHTWRDLTEYAQGSGTAIFGLAPPPVVFNTRGLVGFATHAPETSFDAICQLTGGSFLFADRRTASSIMTNFVAMLRERYIVDFPRPSNATAGRHRLDVRVQQGTSFVRPGGISVPIADPAVRNDPLTVPSDPSLAPVQGQRAPLPDAPH